MSTNNVLREVSAAAASGLPIDGQLSNVFVRDNAKSGRPSCKWDPTYRGMIALALASGFVTDVQSGVVRDADHFEFCEGSEPRLVIAARCSKNSARSSPRGRRPS